jgi:potassium-dependent mechanosensitive channel
VPNSYFLENNIINWTHNDNVVRCEISIGVAYGTPTDQVRDLLVRAADDHGLVHDKPAPYVWLSDFGDNALNFDLLFWITITSKVGRQQIESDVRFHIDRVFREAGITIAFPQRDIHLDTSRPLQFEFVQRKKKDIRRQERANRLVPLTVPHSAGRREDGLIRGGENRNGIAEINRHDMG